jgi:hypothetical protein
VPSNRLFKAPVYFGNALRHIKLLKSLIKILANLNDRFLPQLTIPPALSGPPASEFGTFVMEARRFVVNFGIGGL